MKAFSCPNCSPLVFVHNSVCLRCNSDLGFDPVQRTIVIPDDTTTPCANLDLASCNGLLASHAEVEEHEARNWKPTVVFVDEKNRIVPGRSEEIPGPARRIA